MEVVYAVEKTGSSSGKPSSRVSISDAGELPLLHHHHGAHHGADAAAAAEAAAEAAAAAELADDGDDV